MAERSFEVICEIEPATRPDLTKVRHQIGVLSTVATGFLVPDNHIGRATVSSIAVAHEVERMGGRAIACVNARDLDGGPSDPLPQPPLANRCFLCHGEAGRSRHVFIPTLAGQRRSYLSAQLKSFHDTRWIDLTRPGPSRVHSMMTRQGMPLNDAQIDDLAAYFSSQNCR